MSNGNPTIQSGAGMGKFQGLYDCNDSKYDEITEAAYTLEQRRMNLDELLMDAIQRGDLKETIELIGKGANPKTSGLTALHKAAFYGRLEICRYLVQVCKVDVNAVDGNSLTPLHRAAYRGHLDVCKYLVDESGADIWLVDRTGLTPAQIAQRYGQSTVAKWLINKAAVNPPEGWIEISGSVFENSSHYKKAMDLVGCRVSITLKGGLFSKRQTLYGTVVKYDEYKVKHQIRLDETGELEWHYLDFIGKPLKYKLLQALPKAPKTGLAEVVSPNEFVPVAQVIEAKPVDRQQ